MEECMNPDGPERTWLDDYRDERLNKHGLLFIPKSSREVWDTESHDPLTRDVAFNRHSMNDSDHVSPSDNSMIQVGTDNIRVALAQGINEEDFKRTLSAAVRATVGLDLTQGDALDAHGDWEEMLKGGLQTALETQTIVFAVGGVSRTCTHQLVRTRRAAFHQQSQRASYMGDAPEFRMPESVWSNVAIRQQWLKSLMLSWRTYRATCEADISYQDARFILPEGTTNFILLEYPVKEFLNVYQYRACSMFQWEIVAVMRKCREVLIEAHPWLEPYIKISCEKTGPATFSIAGTCICPPEEHLGDEKCPIHGIPGRRISSQTVEHHCTFQGWEDVEGQCPFTWARHEARTFKPTYHRISREKP